VRCEVGGYWLGDAWAIALWSPDTAEASYDQPYIRAGLVIGRPLRS